MDLDKLDVELIIKVAAGLAAVVLLLVLTSPIHGYAPRCCQFFMSRVIRCVKCKGLKPFTTTPMLDDDGPTLLLGSMPRCREDVEGMMEKHGKVAILSLNALWELKIAGLSEQDLRELNVEFLRLPTPDYYAPRQSDIDKGVDFAANCLDSGSTVLIHCNAGRGRSTVIMLCVLMQRLGVSLDTAFDHVRLRRKVAKLRAMCRMRPQWRACKRYEKRLREHGGRYEGQVAANRKKPAENINGWAAALTPGTPASGSNKIVPGKSLEELS
eukprot:TRINITY_DN44436_c0_g1_i1.p1 TRINITY_DN44436_c0_g1~~TRINITY_DN44436_c0_g1_i1.p1  ORF type:complete len:269 (+),score=33.55 TRINITY_DN44436_c0_g1_i1:92-898(+)